MLPWKPSEGHPQDRGKRSKLIASLTTQHPSLYNAGAFSSFWMIEEIQRLGYAIKPDTIYLLLG